jgi:hypothetical protein
MALLALGAVMVIAADESSSPLPTVRGDGDEPFNISSATLRSSSGTQMDLRLRDASGTALDIPLTTFLQRVFLRPARWLENNLYTLTLRVADSYGNEATAPYSFRVNSTGQRITLLVPENGGTNNTGTSFIIETELESECRWLARDTLVLEEHLFELIMQPFNDSNSRTHILLDYFDSIGIEPVEDEETIISVTCKDGERLTAKLFYITYLLQPPVFNVSNSPNPVVDPLNPVTTLFVRANQEVWCTGNGEQWFGPLNIDSYRRSPEGTYRDVAPVRPEKNASIECFNRIGLSSIVNHAIRFNYDASIEINVTSADFTNNRAYQLTFNTNKLAICTVRRGTTTWSIVPQAFARNFAATPPGSAQLAEGYNTITISCNSGLGLPSDELNHTVLLDTARPTLGVVTQPISCGLNSISFLLNASDPAPSSGIGGYNYTLLARSNSSVIIPWTTTTSSQVTIRNLQLRNGTEYTVRAIAVDRAGNPSTQADAHLKATGANELACDREPPVAVIYGLVRNGTTYAHLDCRDNVACAPVSYCNVVRGVDSDCSADRTNTSQRYTNTTNGLPILVSSTVCCSVADLSGNIGEAVRNFVIRNGTGNISNETNQTIPNPVVDCYNGVKDWHEADVDCGGIFCTGIGRACSDGKECLLPIDCRSSVCDGGICVAPSCTDGVKNGDETGVDCGGSCPATCSTFNSCTTDDDCATDEKCERSVCVPSSSLNRDPSRPDPQDPTTPGGFRLLNIMLIVAGILSMTGGTAYILLYEDKHKRHEEQGGGFDSNNLYSADEYPLTVTPPIMQRSERAIRRKQKGAAKERVQDALKDFDSAEEQPATQGPDAVTETNLDAAVAATHHDLEAAYEQLSPEEFKEKTEKLLEDDKTDKYHVAVALTDLKHKEGVDGDAIDELRSHFNIESAETEDKALQSADSDIVTPEASPATIEEDNWSETENAKSVYETKPQATSKVSGKPKKAKKNKTAKKKRGKSK